MAAPEPTPRLPQTRQVSVMFEPTRLAATYLSQVYSLLLPDARAAPDPARAVPRPAPRAPNPLRGAPPSQEVQHE
jgi:hypothetical protein